MELKIIAIGSASTVTGALFLVWSVVQVWKRTGDPSVKKHLAQLLYFLDAQCDNMEIPAKRTQTVMAIQALLGWKRIWIPMVLIGFALDLIVKIIRKTGIPDLHKNEKSPDMTPDPNDEVTDDIHQTKI